MKEKDLLEAKKELIALINKIEIAKFFEKIDEFDIESNYLASLKQEFISGSKDFNFSERCKVFVSNLVLREGKVIYREGNLPLHKVDYLSYILRFIFIIAGFVLLIFSFCILFYSLYQLITKNNTNDITLSILDKHNVNLNYIKVDLIGGKLIENGDDNRYYFELKGELPDSLHFNISIFGVDTSFTVSANQDLNNICFKMNDVEKKDIDDIKRYIYELEGRDTLDRVAKFNLLILDKSYFWSVGDSVNIATDAKGTRKDVCAFLRSKYSFLFKLKARKGIICIGNACETDYNPHRYNRLAYLRARNLAECFNKDFTKIYTLNLGQHKKTNSVIVDNQRVIVIIGITDNKEGADEKQALYNAFLSQQDLPFNIINFENVDILNQQFINFETFK